MSDMNKTVISNWASREKAKDPAISFLTDKVEMLFQPPTAEEIQKQLENDGFELVSKLNMEPGSVTWVRRR